MTLAALAQEARASALAIRGAFHPTDEDAAPGGCATLLLLGPDEPRFWPLFRASPEHTDGAADPLDRWSKRVIGALAARWGGEALFPSDGPPYPPFLGWARAGGAWSSPIGLLVQSDAGLLVSYRGAVALPRRIPLPEPPEPPCRACAAPCASACPVGALRPGLPYDVSACQDFLRRAEGRSCREGGCRARLACPLSAAIARHPEQAAFHMAAFMENGPR